MKTLSVQDAEYVSSLLTKGIEKDPKTGLAYFTGYEYKALYDWDQYFESIVQLNMGWNTTYAINGIKIFLEHQKDNGFIPRSTPERPPENQEHVKPFLSRIALLCLEHDGNIDFIDEGYYERMKKYLLYWLSDLSNESTGLSIWNSAPHSGMDNQHERAGWWMDCFSQGVDLNNFLYMELLAFSEISGIKGKEDDRGYFENRAKALKESINQYLWDEETGFYYDRNAKTDELIKIKSSCAFSALWAGTASPRQAERLVEHLTNEKEFWRPFPLPSYAADEPGYSEDYLQGDIGCCWRANTWVPVNYYTVLGLRKYGYNDIADKLSQITHDTVKRLGSSEYYTSESVEKRGLDPFWGWSLLAYFM